MIGEPNTGSGRSEAGGSAAKLASRSGKRGDSRTRQTRPSLCTKVSATSPRPFHSEQAITAHYHRITPAQTEDRIVHLGHPSTYSRPAKFGKWSAVNLLPQSALRRNAKVVCTKSECQSPAARKRSQNILNTMLAATAKRARRSSIVTP
jgi:hypothetical protein